MFKTNLICNSNKIVFAVKDFNLPDCHDTGALNALKWTVKVGEINAVCDSDHVHVLKQESSTSLYHVADSQMFDDFNMVVASQQTRLDYLNDINEIYTLSKDLQLYAKTSKKFMSELFKWAGENDRLDPIKQLLHDTALGASSLQMMSVLNTISYMMPTLSQDGMMVHLAAFEACRMDLLNDLKDTDLTWFEFIRNAIISVIKPYIINPITAYPKTTGIALATVLTYSTGLNPLDGAKVLGLNVWDITSQTYIETYGKLIGYQTPYFFPSDKGQEMFHLPIMKYPGILTVLWRYIWNNIKAQYGK